MSMQILKKAKKLGWSEGAELDNQTAAELALHFTDKFYKDLMETKDLLNEVDETTIYRFKE